MSATGHELRRREAAAQQVIDALGDGDVRQFVKDENLPCEPTLSAVAAYLPTHDRVSLEAMAARVTGRSSARRDAPADDAEDAADDTGESVEASETTTAKVDPEAMSRDEMVAFLEERGQAVGARAKDETLRKRVAQMLEDG